MNKAIFLVTFLLVFLAACNQPRVPDQLENLPAPELRIENQGGTSFSISWSPIDGAAYYTWQGAWMEKPSHTQDTLLSFRNLEPDSTYVVKVMATPENEDLYLPSAYSEISVTLAPYSGDMFSIKVDDDKDRMCYTVTITPYDPEMVYYRETFEDVMYGELGGTPESAWTNALAAYREIFGDYTLDMVASVGEDVYEVFYRYEEHTYIVVAGIDSSLGRITPIVDTVLYGGDVPPSDLTFEVSFENVTSSEAVAYITPSDKDANYSIICMESRLLEGFTEKEVRDLVKYTYQSYVEDNHLYTDDMSMTYRQLTPGTSHTLLIFGWNTVPDTEIFRFTFTTEKAASSETLTFDITAEVQGPTEIKIRIVPSDLQAQYIVVPMPQEEYEMFKDNLISYVDYVCDGMIEVSEYVKMFAVTGVTDRVLNDWDDGIMPGSSYVLWAVGVDAEGEDVRFYEPHVHGQVLTTPQE